MILQYCRPSIRLMRMGGFVTYIEEEPNNEQKMVRQ